MNKNDADNISALLYDIRRAELVMQAGQGSENPDVQHRTHAAAASRDTFITLLRKHYNITWPEF